MMPHERDAEKLRRNQDSVTLQSGERTCGVSGWRFGLL
jgi:hypothetical protein